MRVFITEFWYTVFTQTKTNNRRQMGSPKAADCFVCLKKT